MIAIAGSKGGVGKTVLTLGLAEAFGRKEIPTIAVDADCQLPNLHVTADVGRRPTLARITDGNSATEIAQASPREPYVGVLPAPQSSTNLDLESTLSQLDVDSRKVIIDCPSGVGPDLIEPIRAAEGVIIVTTPTTRSLTAAEKTIDVARRLGTPIFGIVVNKCDAVPDGLESRFDAPIIGTVPECSSPVTDDAAREAYDGITTELSSVEFANGTLTDPSSGTLSLGITGLDHLLEGGVPEGSIVAVTADPASQSEQFLYTLTATRGTLYLTTERSSQSISRALAVSDVETGNPTVRHLSGDEVLEQATTLIRKLPAGANLIVDSIEPLERAEYPSYVNFLRTVTDHIRETGSLAVFHCLEGPHEPTNRAVTKRMADVVCGFQTTEPGWETDTKYHLSITKSRYTYGSIGTVEIETDSMVERRPDVGQPEFE